MKRGFVLFFSLLLVFIVSISLVSAFSLGDFWGQITGRATTETTTSSGGGSGGGGGSSANSLVYSNDGSNLTGGQNGVLVVSDSVRGQVLSFDGVNDYISVPVSSGSPLSLSTQTFSFSLWTYMKDTSPRTQLFIFRGKNGVAWGSYIFSYGGTECLENNGKYYFGFRTGGGSCAAKNVMSTGSAITNQWVHLAGVYDGSNLKLYINGVLNNSASASGMPYNSGSAMYIGSDSGTRGTVNGKLDEIKIYNRILSDTEIKNLAGINTQVCGNGIVETGEECDDGNLTSADWCSSQCKKQICADTDGGKNYLIKGTASGIYGSLADSCITQSDGKVWIKEAYCDENGPWSAGIAIACPLGTMCSDGACIDEPYSCTDGGNEIIGTSLSEESVRGSDVIVLSDTTAKIYLEDLNAWLDVELGKAYEFGFGKAIIKEINYYGQNDERNQIIVGYTNLRDRCENGTNRLLNAVCGSDRGDYDEIECLNGCSDGICMKNSNMSTCTQLINKIKNPSDYERYGINYILNWQNNYTSEWWMDDKYYTYAAYVSSWSVDRDTVNEEDQNKYYQISYHVSVFDDINVDANKFISSMVDYNVCKIDSYWTEDNEKNVVYICNWDLFRNQQSVDNYQNKYREVVWSHDNVIVSANVYVGDYLSDEEVIKINQKKLNDFVDDLIDNSYKYADWSDFDIDYPLSDDIYQSVAECSSDVIQPTNQQGEECNPSWQCRTEPTICPEYGYQKRTCIDYNCDSKPREEQIYCSPGICSGCYVPRWFEGKDDICMPYGIRFEHQTGWNIEDVFVNNSDKDGLSIEQVNQYNQEGSVDNLILEIYPNSTAYLQISSREIEPLGLILEEGKTYDWNFDDDENFNYTLFVDNIVYNTTNYNKSYIEVTFHTTGSYTQENPETINAYCDIDGQIKQQRIKSGDGSWAKCQNNYECDSNLCSGGECVEINDAIRNIGAFRGLTIKALCRITNLFEGNDAYNQCLGEYLGY